MKRRLRTLRAFAAAKVNLGWRVGALRADGFHEVSGLQHTISLWDALHFEVYDSDEDVTGDLLFEAGSVRCGLSIEGAEAAALVSSEANLAEDNSVVAAARLIAVSAPPRPTSIRLVKEIPVAAGLGGGSADAAAALTALSILWGAPLSAGDLVRLAARIGSDVPALLLGGLVHASGRGEVVRSVGAASGMALVLGIPDARIDTAEAYRALDRLRGRVPVPRPDHWWANDLEPAAVGLEPALAAAIAAMRDAGAPEAFVSGSGPTVVGVVPDPALAEGVAQRVAGEFRRVIVAKPTAWGVRLALGSGPAGDE